MNGWAVEATVRRRLVTLTLVLLAALGSAGTGSSTAETRPITGTFARTGYTLVAVTPSGVATSVRLRRDSFRLRTKAKTVTLQLRAPNGRYAGPVVVSRTRTRAVMGVRVGARLGRILMKRGFATLARPLSARFMDTTRWARARRGVPIGARTFGRVRSLPPRTSPAGDTDADGIPDVFDVDDDGDLVLDKVDRSTLRRQSTSRRVSGRDAGDATWSTPANFIKTFLPLPLYTTVNANARSSADPTKPAFSDDVIDAALPENAQLLVGVIAGGTAELDCGQPQNTDPSLGGLPYCTTGGTGKVFKGDGQCCTPRSAWPSFPESRDSDGDGFGTLTSPVVGGAFWLSPGATTNQMGTGDTLIERVTDGSGVETSYPSVVEYVFATAPTLVDYSDGQGHVTTVSYPVKGPDPGPAGPGTLDNPFPVSADPASGHTVVTLKFWRPQRRPMPGEVGYTTQPTEWTDIGGLVYGVQLSGGGGSCSQSAFLAADPADPHLIESPAAYHQLIGGGFLDTNTDQLADPANTLTYRFDITGCMTSLGRTFEVGEKVGFDFSSASCGGDACLYGNSSGPDQASTGVYFARV